MTTPNTDDFLNLKQTFYNAAAELAFKGIKDKRLQQEEILKEFRSAMEELRGHLNEHSDSPPDMDELFRLLTDSCHRMVGLLDRINEKILVDSLSLNKATPDVRDSFREALTSFDQTLTDNPGAEVIRTSAGVLSGAIDQHLSKMDKSAGLSKSNFISNKTIKESRSDAPSTGPETPSSDDIDNGPKRS